MSDLVTIAVDAMGGDHGPEETVKAAARLSLDQPTLHTILVGDAGVLSGLMAAHRHNPERMSLQHAAQSVPMGAKPDEALRSMPDASITVAAKLVAEGRAQALVSAGNTGASVLTCARTFKLVPGIRRAALAAVYPTQAVRGPKQDPFALLLDVGATVEATGHDLVGFAVMGAAYAHAISANESPKVALLSNGVEANKGPRSVRDAHALLKGGVPGVQFVGNMEGVDLHRGMADVVVCDGYVGNVVLKMLEGMGETALALAQYAAKEKLMWRAGLAMLSDGFEQLKTLTDWEEYGGALFLGFDHLFIKAHGRSRARALGNAIRVAAKGARAKLPETIAQRMAAVAPPPPEELDSSADEVTAPMRRRS